MFLIDLNFLIAGFLFSLLMISMIGGKYKLFGTRIEAHHFCVRIHPWTEWVIHFDDAAAAYVVIREIAAFHCLHLIGRDEPDLCKICRKSTQISRRDRHIQVGIISHNLLLYSVSCFHLQKSVRSQKYHHVKSCAMRLHKKMNLGYFVNLVRGMAA